MISSKYYAKFTIWIAQCVFRRSEKWHFSWNAIHNFLNNHLCAEGNPYVITKAAPAASAGFQHQLWLKYWLYFIGPFLFDCLTWQAVRPSLFSTTTVATTAKWTLCNKECNVGYTWWCTITFQCDDNLQIVFPKRSMSRDGPQERLPKSYFPTSVIFSQENTLLKILDFRYRE